MKNLSRPLEDYQHRERRFGKTSDQVRDDSPEPADN